MALYDIIDGQILPETEGRNRIRRDAPRAACEPGAASARRASGCAPLPADATSGAVRFQPIGIGRPLLVQIRHLYTGTFPAAGFLSTAADVAVVSGVKDFDVFAVSGRALNLVQRSVAPHSALRGSAFNDGTALVSYTPSLLKPEIKVTVEIVVARFPTLFVEAVSQAIAQLRGLPLFLPWRGLLLGARELVAISGEGAAALYDAPVFSQTEKLTFDLGGAAPDAPRFRLLANPGLDVEGLIFRDGIGLIDHTGTPYRGDEPYVVLSVDGRDMPAFATFAATAASSAILQRLFAGGPATGAPLDALVEGIRLVSDMKHRARADALAHALTGEPGGPRKAALRAERDAVIRNILTEALRP